MQGNSSNAGILADADGNGMARPAEADAPIHGHYPISADRRIIYRKGSIVCSARYTERHMMPDRLAGLRLLRAMTATIAAAGHPLGNHHQTDCGAANGISTGIDHFSGDSTGGCGSRGIRRLCNGGSLCRKTDANR